MNAWQIEVVDQSRPVEMQCDNCKAKTWHILACQPYGVGISVPFSRKPLASSNKAFFLLCYLCCNLNYRIKKEEARALKSMPTEKEELAGCHYIRGIAYGNMGEVNKALEAYNLSIAVEPTNPMPYLNIGAIYLYMEKYNDAVSYFYRAFELGDDIGVKAVALSNMGQAYCGLGDYEKAAECQEKSLQWEEGATIFVELGVTYSNMGKNEDARAMFEKYLSWDGDPSDKLYPEEEVRRMMEGL